MSLSAGALTLPAVGAGPFTASLDVGPLALSAGGTLRPSGTKLVFP